MALTPEDVVNKRFQPTKFREGYDQDEVDDFLDEVVVELRRLTQENDELRQRLATSESRPAEPSHDAVLPPVASGNVVHEAAPFVAPASVPAAEPVAPESAVPAEISTESSDSNSLLQLARRLHDEHVREGMEKRDALIAEGHSTAARIVGEAESRQRAQRESMEKERAQLELHIDDLRTFEREYRVKLKSYIESQLRDLDSSGDLSGSGAAVAAESSFTDSTPDSSSQKYSGGFAGNLRAPHYEEARTASCSPGALRWGCRSCVCP
jgi:DivIVA domain-containing protein